MMSLYILIPKFLTAYKSSSPDGKNFPLVKFMWQPGHAQKINKYMDQMN